MFNIIYNPNACYKNYEKLCSLGKGSSADVFLCKNDDYIFCTRIMKTDNYMGDVQAWKNIFNIDIKHIFNHNTQLFEEYVPFVFCWNILFCNKSANTNNYYG